MVGSKGYFEEEIDGAVNVTTALRQPGSSFKPIVYTAGFVEGYTPNSILYDVLTTFKTEVSDYTPNNYTLGSENGPVTIRKALQGSLNIPAVKMIALIGVEKVLNFAESLGYTSFADRSRFGLAIVLGGAEVKLIEHAAAYGAFANDGAQHKTASILKVEDPKGATLYEWKEEAGKQVVDQNVAREISSVLSDNAARAYIFGEANRLTLSDRAVAAKTGTTNDYHDAWTRGYTPSLVAGVWVGNTRNEEMVRGADGSVIAAPIWQEYMQKALAGSPAEGFNPPAIPITGKDLLDGHLPSTTFGVDKSTGKLATDETPVSMRETRSCGEYHSELYYITPGDPLGPVPGEQPNDPQYVSWEAAIQSWVDRVKATDASRLPFDECEVPTEEDDVHTRANRPDIEIQEPDSKEKIEGRSFRVEVETDARRGVERVEYYIDDRFVKSSGSSTGTTIDLPGWVEVGKHDFKAIAYDDVDNSASDTISITVADGPTDASADIIDPLNGQTVGSTGDTYQVIVQLRDPDSVRQLVLYVENLRGSGSGTIGIKDNPGNTFETFGWNLPAAGEYVIWAEAEGSDGNRSSSSQVRVTIREAEASADPLDLTDNETSDTDVVPSDVEVTL